MKYSLFLLIALFSSLQTALADVGVLQWLWTWDQAEEKIRKGDIHVDDIPAILQWAINFFMYFAGTISLIFIIVGAYKILFGSLEQDKSKGKDTIFMALMGFGIAALAGFIIKLVIDNFT